MYIFIKNLFYLVEFLLKSIVFSLDNIRIV